MRSLFVTGTDTGVGKTVVCGLLAHYLQSQGHDVVTQKWIQSGTQDGDEDIHQHDAYYTQPERSCEWETWRVPYRFLLPASPHLAAAVEEGVIDRQCIEKAFHQLALQAGTVIVEGIGGLLVPLNQKILVVDIAQGLNLPVLVVVANKLGAINHTLLTLEALRHRDMEILGLVFNDVPNQDPTVASDNPRIIQTLTDVPVLGHLPWVTERDVLIDSFTTTGQSLAAALT